jgi:hypothetical protein
MQLEKRPRSQHFCNPALSWTPTPVALQIRHWNSGWRYSVSMLTRRGGNAASLVVPDTAMDA